MTIKIQQQLNQGVLDAVGNTPLVVLNRLFGHHPATFVAKLEAVNPGGSLKDRTARHIVCAAIERGELQAGDTVIESSSGNMAIGLAQACSYFDLRLIIVVDPNVNPQTVHILRAYGAYVEMVTTPHPEEGFLGARLERVQALLKQEARSFWPNQYANPLNPDAHYHTMRELVETLGYAPDYLFAATSTCGTLMGCARYAAEHGLTTKLVAVDALGSAIFNSNPCPRHIPGHGAGRPAPLLERDAIDHVVHVSDLDCVAGCRQLLAHEAILAGGSSGAVVAAVSRQLPSFSPYATVALILCDRGERYLDTIYSDAWVDKLKSGRLDRKKS